jgi:hypothetical protein
MISVKLSEPQLATLRHLQQLYQTGRFQAGSLDSKAEEMPVAPKITLTEVRRQLKTRWHQDFNNMSHTYRTASVLAGSVTFREEKHTGTKQTAFICSFYTGNPARRWWSRSFTTLQAAVAWGNEHRQHAVDASARELGENFLADDTEG